MYNVYIDIYVLDRYDKYKSIIKFKIIQNLTMY